VTQGEGYGQGKPRAREPFTPDKNHSEWFDTMDQRGKPSRASDYEEEEVPLPETPALPSPLRLGSTCLTARSNDEPFWVKNVEGVPGVQVPSQRKEAARQQEPRQREAAYESQEEPSQAALDPSRASQATQAARVLHQAGLNPIP